MNTKPVNKYRKSKQRTQILELLRTTKNHPTAMRLYEQLRPEFPTLSLGNIYRNLSILVELGEINELQFGSTFDRYDGNVTPHYHFVCEKCATITDLDLTPGELLNQRVEQSIGCKVEYHRLEFYGRCDECLD